MNRYVIMLDNRNHYEKNYTMPFINIIPGIIWSIPIIQIFMDDVGTPAKFGFGIVFAFLYVVLTLVPVLALAPCIAGAIIYIGMLWSLADHLGDGWIKITIKAVIAVFIGLLELSLFINATLPWLERKTDEGPVIRRIEE